jgi:hypothetical protein
MSLFLDSHEKVGRQRWPDKLKCFLRRLLMLEKERAARARPAPGISHPKPKAGKKWLRYFAACGFVAEGVQNVYGQLKDQGNPATPYPGVQIYPPSPDTGFWVIHFNGNFPVGPVGNEIKYTLEVYDKRPADGGKQILDPVKDLVFRDPSWGVEVDYPNGDRVCTEFAASGTAPGSGDVTGTISGACSGQCQQGVPGPNWILYCLLSGGSPGDTGKVTVSQDGTTAGSGSFTIGPC